MSKKRILYISQEITPFLPENPLSKLSLDLPKKMVEAGNEVRVFMPRFGVINERKHQLHEVIRLSGINIVVNDMDMPLIIKVASVPHARMQVYFIDNDEFFRRKNTFFNDEGQPFEDNDERFVFFSKGVLETVKKLSWSPDIIHISGWLPALIPLYIKKYYNNDPLFSDSKIIYTRYTFPYQQILRSPNQLNEILAFDGLSGDSLGDEVIDVEKFYALAAPYCDTYTYLNPPPPEGELKSLINPDAAVFELYNLTECDSFFKEHYNQIHNFESVES
ncbi:MAG: glycogen/starch synthase [Thermaurantimonas sp.]